MAESDLHRLPQPDLGADVSLGSVLQQRRSVRSFAAQPLSLAEVAQLLWAAQGISSDQGLRTAPSAGALYPLELHLLAGEVEDLNAGSYRYDPARHALTAEKVGDLRTATAAAALHQDWIAQAPVIVVIAAVDARTTRKYGRRGVRYVHMEAGHAGQNLLLQAVALGLGGAIVGAFDDTQLHRLLDLPEDERPLALIALGHPR